MPHTLSADELAQHLYALDVSGYTIIPHQVSEDDLNELRETSDRALNAVDEAMAAGAKLAHTAGNPYYKGVRCLYCWSETALRLLEHETLHALSTRIFGTFALTDLGVLSALPAPEGHAASTSWHRDFDAFKHGSPVPHYIWFFLCLDDVSPENGATIFVPGSHRRSAFAEPSLGKLWNNDDFSAFPSRVQPSAKAGDLIVLNPMLLHTSGHNRTARPRRLVNIGVGHEAAAPFMDHWSIAGPAIQEKASPRLRMMLGADRKSLDETWTVLPPGWQTSPRHAQEVRV